MDRTGPTQSGPGTVGRLGLGAQAWRAPGPKGPAWALWALGPKPCLSIWILGAYGANLGSILDN